MIFGLSAVLLGISYLHIINIEEERKDERREHGTVDESSLEQAIH